MEKPTHFSSVEQSPMRSVSSSQVFDHSKSTVFIPLSLPTCRASQLVIAIHYLSYSNHHPEVRQTEGDMRLIQRGLVISCERTCSAMGAVRIWQRWGWAVCNYVDPMACLRNSQWWCLMIMLILGSFAKGVYILYNPSFMLKIPIQHFWATRAAVRKEMAVCTNFIAAAEDAVKRRWTSQYIHPTLSGVRDRGRMGGGHDSITWLLSRCILTLLSFCVMLTHAWVVWRGCVFASVSSHIHTFAEVYVCFISL